MYKIVYNKNTKQIISYTKITSKFVTIGIGGNDLAVADVSSIPTHNAGKTLFYENGRIVVKG
uniref:Uncharacterized protein n=1 Tax=Siphoviridae sp. cttDR14 TaxID=2826490 RepID=A0A8S5M2A1_9CAUD|nr:MAG TPA: hypothetical protein [Siphoviridae sp. cttDR14]